MGYSVAVPCRSYEIRDRMMDLLRVEYKTWPELIENPEASDFLRGPLTDDLSYHHGRCFIGFDFNASGGQRHYLFALIRWLALTIGRKTPVAKCPYYVYDGHSVTPVCTDPSQDGCVDQWGVPIQTPTSRLIKGKWWVQFELDMLHQSNSLPFIRTEIMRLEFLWKNKR